MLWHTSDASALTSAYTAGAMYGRRPTSIYILCVSVVISACPHTTCMQVRTLVTEATVNESSDPGLLLRRYERQIRELKQELAMRDMLRCVFCV